MSWFSDLLGKVFGRKKVQPAPVASALQNKPPSASATPAEVTYANNTLGWLFTNSPNTMPQRSRYHTENPPAIEPDVLVRLRTHIKQIPPMPEIWHQVQDILQQPGASASDLGKCVEQDPVLTARILTVCNSSAYAERSNAEITNIRLAIARLGLNETSTVIFHSLAPDLGGSAYKKLEIHHIWFHSQAISLLSRLLAEPSTKLDRYQASLAGMLHDIGKLVMLHIEPEAQLIRLMNKVDQGGGALAAEYQEFGYTHIDAGMMLALHWRLPKSVQQMISLHHHPDTIKTEELSENTQHLTIALQAAHLILHHIMKDAGDQDQLSIWQGQQRICRDDITLFVQNKLNIPFGSKALYTQIQETISRLQLSFPDLFPARDES